MKGEGEKRVGPLPVWQMWTEEGENTENRWNWSRGEEQRSLTVQPARDGWMEGCRGSDQGLKSDCWGRFASRRQELGWPSPVRMNTPYTLRNTFCHAFLLPGLPSYSLSTFPFCLSDPPSLSFSLYVSLSLNSCCITMMYSVLDILLKTNEP